MSSPEIRIHPDGETKRSKTPQKCHICGANITYSNGNRHFKTKKHRDAKYIHFEKFEMK